MSSQKVLDRLRQLPGRGIRPTDLGNRPSNEKNPVWLCWNKRWNGEVRTSGSRRDEHQSGRGGFGGLLAVGGGSVNPLGSLSLNTAAAKPNGLGFAGGARLHSIPVACRSNPPTACL